MSELKEYINGVFTDLRSKLEIEYKHQLKNHFANMTDNLDATNFTRGHGELTQISDTRIKLPQPLEGRWWIHMAYSNVDGTNRSCVINFYDNFGQPFVRTISYNPFDPSLPYNFQEQKQSVEKTYQYPLPDLFIDFVKKQQTIEGLNTIADMFHQIIYLYAI